MKKRITHMFIRTSPIKEIGLLLCLLVGSTSVSAQKIIERIQAHVGNEVILHSDVQRRLSQMEKMPQFAKLSLAEKEEICLNSRRSLQS